MPTPPMPCSKRWGYTEGDSSLSTTHYPLFLFSANGFALLNLTHPYLYPQHLCSMTLSLPHRHYSQGADHLVIDGTQRRASVDQGNPLCGTGGGCPCWVSFLRSVAGTEISTGRTEPLSRTGSMRRAEDPERRGCYKRAWISPAVTAGRVSTVSSSVMG